MPPIEEKKKPRPKDVFGRLLPTEEQFEVLKNAPRSVSSAIFLISGIIMVVCFHYLEVLSYVHLVLLT